MQTTITEKYRKMLLKKFHVLLGKAGIDENGKREMLAAYGVTSSRDLSAHELLDLCDRIERMMDKKAVEADKWRKRLIASIFAWRRATGRPSNMDEVKAIACRASGSTNFNSIPLERLRSLYYAFTKKAKDLDFVEKLTGEELEYAGWVN